MQTLKVQIDSILKSKDEDINDPFQKFIMEFDSARAPPVDLSENDKLMTNLQVISSVCNLLLQFEMSVLINSEETQKNLEEVSQLIKYIVGDERAKSAKGISLVISIFRFY